jgi:hypothetical protein
LEVGTNYCVSLTVNADFCDFTAVYDELPLSITNSVLLLAAFTD